MIDHSVKLFHFVDGRLQHTWVSFFKLNEGLFLDFEISFQNQKLFYVYFLLSLPLELLYFKFEMQSLFFKSIQLPVLVADFGLGVVI